MRKSFILAFIITVAFIAAETLFMPEGFDAKPFGVSSCADLPDAPSCFFRESDNGRRVSLPVGTTFCIELSENGTTGYRWQQTPVDERLSDVVSPIAEQSFAPDDTAAVGVGGVYRMIMRVEKPGIYPLTLSYVRPWEKNEPPAKVWHLDIEAVR